MFETLKKMINIYLQNRKLKKRLKELQKQDPFIYD